MRTTHLLLLSLLGSTPAFAVGGADLMVPLDRSKAESKPDLRPVEPPAALHVDAVEPLRCSSCAAVKTTGLVVAGLAYVGSIALAVHAFNQPSRGGYDLTSFVAPFLAVPVFGPIAGALYVFPDDRPAMVLSAIDAGAQIAGLALALYGVHMQSEWLKNQLVVAPMIQPGQGGIQFAGTF